MTDHPEVLDALHDQAQRRAGRRAFFKAAVGAAAVGTGAFVVASAAQAQTVTDNDVLNFALNLEYLEANFYYYAVYGTPIPLTSTAGTGAFAPATPTVATNPINGTVTYNRNARAVAFTDNRIAELAREIAQDELAHVNYLRQALSGAAVAQPLIDIGDDPVGAFSTAARAAGLIGTSGSTTTGTGTSAVTTKNPETTTFDPYASDLAFLYGAFIFEDVGVTAYKGASPLITNKAYLDAAAGILATEAYHAAAIRTTIDQRGGQPGLAAATIRADTELVSNARDSLDGATDLDQGIAYVASGAGATSNIAPTDPNGIGFSRTTGQVLNIVYLNRGAVTAGGFFPAGVNGTIRSSTNNNPA